MSPIASLFYLCSSRLTGALQGSTALNLFWLRQPPKSTANRRYVVEKTELTHHGHA